MFRCRYVFRDGTCFQITFTDCKSWKDANKRSASYFKLVGSIPDSHLWYISITKDFSSGGAEERIYWQKDARSDDEVCNG